MELHTVTNQQHPVLTAAAVELFLCRLTASAALSLSLFSVSVIPFATAVLCCC
jgi:hypothetical protein